MAVPAFRTSPSRKRKRRSHHALTRSHLVTCPNCGNPRQPHAACRQCGYVRPGLTITTGTE
ncbi:MAG: 50S ribosomal protein L32 [Phycisphaerales bacterium]|nr:50S ribosomal protein L32 [Phycisphaerales bacterium]